MHRGGQRVMRGREGRWRASKKDRVKRKGSGGEGARRLDVGFLWDLRLWIDKRSDRGKARLVSVLHSVRSNRMQRV
jgi:hypothetical protein